MLHHTSKSGDQRGTSAREDNIDTSIILKRPFDYTPEDGARFIVHFSKTRVNTSELSLVQDVQLQLIKDEYGQLAWQWGNMKRENKKEVLKLLDEGVSQMEIKDLIGLSKGYISKIKKEAIKDKYLTRENKLTQTGFHLVHEREN